MINYDSILSAFDGKPTLLQWLKLVKKALDESVLKDITLKQDGASVVFTFNFEDGTSISTPAVTLPKGDAGAKGDKGEKGVGVTGVDEVSDEIVGSQTLTTLRFHFSDGTNDEVVVYAENGKTGGVGVIIDQPASATSGTLTANQLTTLQASDNNYIIFNNELYRLADKQHTAGVLSYTHTGWNGTAIQDKSINITISTRAWTLVQGESGGGKLYRHELNITNFGTNYFATVVIYNSKSVQITDYNEFISYAPLYFKVRDDNTANMFEGTVYLTADGDISGFLLSKPTATNISAAEPITGYAVEKRFVELFTPDENEYKDTVTEL